MASKIIVIGSIGSAFREVFRKLEKLHAKQDFSFAIGVGDLFSREKSEDESELAALLQGEINVPLPTYFTVGSRMIPKEVMDKLEKTDQEVCPNLYYLGRRGTLTTSEGVKIAVLGGSLEPSAKPMSGVDEKYLSRYTEFDAKSLYGAQSADILVTHQWPKSIHEGSKVAPDSSSTVESVQPLADLCSVLKPRYHFSSSGDFFFEREPFFHQPSEDAPEIKHVTRFINLARVNNASKQKWMYAFNLDPNAPQPASLPASTTMSPFPSIPSKRRDGESQQESFSRFAREDDSQRPRKRARKAPPGPSECFFCLSNPNVATHLITSIGSDSYVTTAKGPLSTETTFSGLGFPGHMLIIPLTHAPTFGAMDDESVRASTFQEMQRYRSALHTMLSERCNKELGAVTWEVSRGGGIHIHWQFMPVPTELLERGLVDTAFIVEAEKLGYPKFTRGAPRTVSETGEYFRVWIWNPLTSSERGGEEQDPDANAGAETTLVLSLSPSFRFDLQFGRGVMAKILGLEKRVNWKDDTQTQEEEAANAAAFKKAFQKFDFSLTEG